MSSENIVKIIQDASVDAQSLSEFMYKPADFMVERRLSPSIHSLQYYLDYLNTIPSIVNDAINNTAVEGGVLADTFVTATANGVGTIARTQRDVNSDTISVKDFGAVGDGITDDTNSIRAALESGKYLDWLDGTYKVTEPLVISYPPNTSINWVGKGAEIVFENAEHVSISLALIGDKIDVYIDGVGVNGNYKSNTVFAIRNPLRDMTEGTLGEVRIKNSVIQKAKRILAFDSGTCLEIRGGFAKVSLLEGTVIKDCMMSTGSGIAGSVGVTGVRVTFYDEAYAKEVYTSGLHVENIFSEDPDYAHDMDGLLYFSSRSPELVPLPSYLLVANGSSFKNCQGRAIKTQIENTRVSDSFFERNKGGTSKEGNSEIHAQLGDLITNNLTFRYSNGYTGGTCLGVSSRENARASGASIKNNTVILDSETILPIFFTSISSTSTLATSFVDGIRIYGKVGNLAQVYAIGDSSYLKVRDCYVKDFDIANGDVGLVAVKKYGDFTGVPAVDITQCVTDCSTPIQLVRDRIPNVAISAAVSSSGNIGFLDELEGLVHRHNRQVNRIGKIASSLSKGAGAIGHFEVADTVNVPAGESRNLTLPLLRGAIINIVCNSAVGSYAILNAATSGTRTYLENISSGSKMTVNLTTVPVEEEERTDFEVRGGGLNELIFSNHSSSDRYFTVSLLATY